MNMNDSAGRDDALREVAARRISTADAADQAVQETISVAREAAMTIDVQGVESYTLLCTPSDNRALAAGFLLSEGVIDSLDDVTVLKECDEKLRSLPTVEDTLRIDSRILRVVGERLQAHQPLFRACGSTHAACIFDASGEIVASAEDTGRHNALDKAIGRSLLAGRSPAGCGALLSGRVSLEMVGKSARAGIELITAVSAPTSLAIEIAERCAITLCAFVRETRATVFTHPGRITGP
jgi:FdhD protein